MLLERARQVRGTPFMVLLASYFALLYRYTEQEDLVIGFPTAGRVRLELEPLVGAFINSLPVRVTLDKEMSLTDVLQLVRKRTLEAVQHEQLPFEQIVDNLKLERDLSRHPLFQAFLNVMNSPPLNEHDKLAVRVSPVYVPRTSSQFDLNLNVRLTDDQCEVKLIYNTELFAANAMHSLASRFQTTVQAMCRDPEAAIAEYSMLGEQDA